MQLAKLLVPLLLLLPGIPVASASEVSITLPNGLTALADYHEGERKKPAVLVMHGFLQTYRFSTVQLITSELSEAGYSILAPTLTLNIDQRRSSLGCDSVHNHHAARDIEEIGHWIKWLVQTGHQQIILIGHSTGSNHLLGYLRTTPDKNVIAFIATSIGPMKSNEDIRTMGVQIERARQRAAAGDNTINLYTIGFCRDNYAAPASAFLSYQEWTEERILGDLDAINVPTTVLLGENDSWLPAGWFENLKKHHIPTRTIGEANHYFSGPAEFDFQATVLELVDAAAQDRKQR